ncbi:MAG: hypothetical protein QOE46_2129 [Acidobacteriota bacterium]|jgi:hypothetical protein|nr:hypothetical protein [Acidobacteriota bacterium]
MSEEKPTFKVTDRRLFNADGTPRDVPREQEPPPATTATPEPAPTPAATAARPAESFAGESSHADDVAAAPSAGATPRSAEREREELPDAAASDEAQDFLMLVEFLASFAADALGMVNHPGGGGVNLQLAKQCIDMLGTLHHKTRGNLSGEEQQFLDMILSQLRMQYVSLTTAPRPPQGGRGFTGGDITGGR